MFWLGDSKQQDWQGWRPFKRIPLEIRAGIRDRIPKCCIATYVACILASLITKRDAKIFEFVFRRYEDFLETDYWRCPLCKFRGTIVKIRWDTKGYT